MSPTEPDVLTLAEMLRYRRPHASASERKFINRFIRPLGVTFDDYGNMWKRIGPAPSKVLWSAHTDSVHTKSGKQELVASQCGKYIRLAKPAKGDCLGADNAAGVWMLREMILAGVPGLYVFFRNEERGRVGSEHFAKHSSEVWKGCQAAIAFDRRDVASIITHQMPGRTCSDAFAQSLAKALDLGHQLDDGGTYTDTASFYDVIAECTNVSAGFDWEHSAREELDWQYLVSLRNAMLGLELGDLVIERDPHDCEDMFSRYHDRRFDSWFGKRQYQSQFDADEIWNNDDDEADDDEGYTCANMRELICKYPEFVADILEQCGYTAESLAEGIDQISGYTTFASPRTRLVKASVSDLKGV